MDLIADIFLISGALGAGFYCLILSRRLNRLNDLETGVGGAVAVLSAQVDDLTKSLSNAQKIAGQSTQELSNVTQRAEETTRRLELILASMHDIEPSESGQSKSMGPLLGRKAGERNV